MRVLIFHGYLLRGTGSNVYNAELARALVALGHEVHLLCQERNDPAGLGFVDAIGDWHGGALTVQRLREPVRCTIYRPPIGSVLPVYVADRYDGFEARTFDRLSETEVDHYLERNVAAVAEVAALARPEMALANHAVMGPVILARALVGVPYAVKIHGSALEYTVRPHPRFLPFAREGIAPAATVLVGSRHVAERLWETLPELDLVDRTRLGPPGVDVDRFAPRGAAAKAAGLARLIDRLEAQTRDGFDAVASGALDGFAAEPGAIADPEAGARLARVRERYNPSGIDPGAARALRAIDLDADLLVGFVGKLIASKGVELLLAAWPLVAAQVPAARLVITGFGAFREGLELLARAIARGDLDAVAEIAAVGRALEGGDPGTLDGLATFVRGLTGAERDRYLAAAPAAVDRVAWIGRLDHDALVDLVPTFAAQVVPSTFPEAFGMVAAEAAACGVPPVCADHSGLAEVTAALREGVPSEVAAHLSFRLDTRSVRDLADRIVALLTLAGPSRAAVAAGLRGVAVERFSWAGVAGGVIAAAGGRLDDLSTP